MQFEPATFAEYDEPVPPGGAVPPSPYDPVDAVYAAARDLCANGAANGADLSDAVFAYNHSDAYVAEVLDLAQASAWSEAEVQRPPTVRPLTGELDGRPGIATLVRPLSQCESTNRDDLPVRWSKVPPIRYCLQPVVGWRAAVPTIPRTDHATRCRGRPEWTMPKPD